MNAKPKLAIVCNEMATMRTLSEMLMRMFECTWSRDAQGVKHLLREERPPVALLVDNAAVPNGGIALLQLVQQTYPDIRRILITDYCDLRMIVKGLHTAAVHTIVYKPIHPTELLSAVGVTATAISAPAVPTDSATVVAG